jgi:hypothetical protein
MVNILLVEFKECKSLCQDAKAIVKTCFDVVFEFRTVNKYLL